MLASLGGQLDWEPLLLLISEIYVLNFSVFFARSYYFSNASVSRTFELKSAPEMAHSSTDREHRDFRVRSSL